MKIDYWHEFSEGRFYHIYNKAVGNRNMFECSENYERFLKKYQSLFSPYFDTLAYCLMPNHFHLIVRVKKSDEIILKSTNSNKEIEFASGNITVNEVILDQFRRLFSGHTLYLNRFLSTTGSLFQKRFKRVEVHQQKLKYIIAYVHHNPIHHNFCLDYEDWPYSSYGNLIDRSHIFEGQRDFRAYHDSFKHEYRER